MCTITSKCSSVRDSCRKWHFRRKMEKLNLPIYHPGPRYKNDMVLEILTPSTRRKYSSGRDIYRRLRAIQVAPKSLSPFISLSREIEANRPMSSNKCSFCAEQKHRYIAPPILQLHNEASQDEYSSGSFRFSFFH